MPGKTSPIVTLTKTMGFWKGADDTPFSATTNSIKGGNSGSPVFVQVDDKLVVAAIAFGSSGTDGYIEIDSDRSAARIASINNAGAFVWPLSEVAKRTPNLSIWNSSHSLSGKIVKRGTGDLLSNLRVAISLVKQDDEHFYEYTITSIKDKIDLSKLYVMGVPVKHLDQVQSIYGVQIKSENIKFRTTLILSPGRLRIESLESEMMGYIECRPGSAVENPTIRDFVIKDLNCYN